MTRLHAGPRPLSTASALRGGEQLSSQRPRDSCSAALRGVAIVLSVVALAACQSGPPRGRVHSAIDEAMAPNVSSRLPPKVPDNITQAMLPPLAGPALPTPALPEPRFDLAVTNAPPAQVFQAIVSGSRYSILLPPQLAGTFSVNLKEVTVREALDAVREMYGFEYRIEGTRIFVQTAALQTRVFQIAYPSARRSGRTDTRVVSGSIASSMNAHNGGGAASSGGDDGGGNEGSRVSTTQDVDFWKEIDSALKTIVGNADGRQTVLSPHTGVLVVRGFPKDLREVENFLRTSRIAIERQVMLEAKIVEVALKDGFESGINWAAFDRNGNHRFSTGVDSGRINVPGSLGRAAGIPTGSVSTIIDSSTTPPTVIPTTLGQLLASPLASGGSGALGLAFTTNSFVSLLSFLETQGSVQVLSSPRVAAINNQKAVLRVGSDDFFITNVSTSTTTTSAGSVTTPSIQTQAFFSGISLDVTPQIDEGGFVTLHIRPVVSNVTERTRIVNLGTLGNFTLPLASSSINEADTVVRVQDGVTVAIGGLMTQTQSDDDARVPGAGDVPVIGNPFKRTNRLLQKRELVFLLRPTVIKSEEQWQSDLASAQSRMRAYPDTPRERLALPDVAGRKE